MKKVIIAPEGSEDLAEEAGDCPQYRFQSNPMDMMRLASPEDFSSLPKTSWNSHQLGEGDVQEEALSTASCQTQRRPECQAKKGWMAPGQQDGPPSQD
ncbi:5-formyltetrahydrofolate cyclo-ligase-like, partial [Onychomys torridus]|uniref:5-formyltetrahydrofolate cyclo-ligase-like n=1 Tax=Onychomys torridus TaxID=38674 RepID=UPI00167F1E79